MIMYKSLDEHSNFVKFERKTEWIWFVVVVAIIKGFSRASVRINMNISLKVGRFKFIFKTEKPKKERPRDYFRSDIYIETTLTTDWLPKCCFFFYSAPTQTCCSEWEFRKRIGQKVCANYLNGIRERRKINDRSVRPRSDLSKSFPYTINISVPSFYAIRPSPSMTSRASLSRLP